MIKSSKIRPEGKAYWGPLKAWCKLQCPLASPPHPRAPSCRAGTWVKVRCVLSRIGASHLWAGVPQTHRSDLPVLHRTRRRRVVSRGDFLGTRLKKGRGRGSFPGRMHVGAHLCSTRDTGWVWTTLQTLTEKSFCQGWQKWELCPRLARSSGCITANQDVYFQCCKRISWQMTRGLTKCHVDRHTVYKETNVQNSATIYRVLTPAQECWPGLNMRTLLLPLLLVVACAQLSPADDNDSQVTEGSHGSMSRCVFVSPLGNSMCASKFTCT